MGISREDGTKAVLMYFADVPPIPGRRPLTVLEVLHQS